ncbi:MAG: hypothetical protein WBP96_03775 [Nitrososphaeraceae archaeon]
MAEDSNYSDPSVRSHPTLIDEESKWKQLSKKTLSPHNTPATCSPLGRRMLTDLSGNSFNDS